MGKMKCFYIKNSSINKFVLLLFMIVTIEVQSLEQKMSSEMNNFSRRQRYAKKSVLKRNDNKMRREEDFKKYDDLNFRFKSSVELNMKDGDENEAVVANAIVVNARKEAAVAEEKE